MSCHFCHILVVRSKSLDPDHPQGEGISQDVLAWNCDSLGGIIAQIPCRWQVCVFNADETVTHLCVLVLGASMARTPRLSSKGKLNTDVPACPGRKPQQQYSVVVVKVMVREGTNAQSSPS